MRKTLFNTLIMLSASGLLAACSQTDPMESTPSSSASATESTSTSSMKSSTTSSTSEPSVEVSEPVTGEPEEEPMADTIPQDGPAPVVPAQLMQQPQPEYIPPAPEPEPVYEPEPEPAPVYEPPAPVAQNTSQAYYASCAEARALGAAPLYSGDPGYRSGLDRDGDGVACE